MDVRLPPAALALVAILSLSACGGGVDETPLGETLSVGYQDLTNDLFTTLDITVTDVRTGTIAELEESGLQFDPEEQELTPYYVDATYENTGDTAVERTMSIGLEDPDGNLIHDTIIFDFSGGEGGEPEGPCPDVGEGELAPGDSFSDCTLFLVDPESQEVARVYFLSQPEDEESAFVYWAAE